MKRVAIIALIVLILGVTLFSVGFIMSGGDIYVLEIETPYAVIDFGGGSDKTAKIVEDTFAPEDVERIDIDCVAEDVTVGTSPDGLLHVISLENVRLKITCVDGKLTVSAPEKRSWHFFNFISGFDSGVVNILLPDFPAPDLEISTVSGDIELSAESFGDVAIDTVSGDAEFDDLDCTSLTADTVSGDVSGTLAGSREGYTRRIDTVSGDKSVSSGGSGAVELNISTVSGNIDIDFME